MTSAELAELFENEAVHFGTSVSKESASMHLRLLANDPDLLKRMTKLVNQVLTNPRFAAEDLEREKQNTYSDLKDIEQDLCTRY